MSAENIELQDLANRVKALEDWQATVEAKPSSRVPQSIADALNEQAMARIKASTAQIKGGLQ